MNRLIRAVRRACEYFGLVEPEGPPPYDPATDPDPFQPLPPTLDDLHVPEGVYRTCGACGDLHLAEAVSVQPLGALSSDAMPKVEIRYRMPECPNRPTTAPPTMSDPIVPLVSSRVVHDEEDGT